MNEKGLGDVKFIVNELFYKRQNYGVGFGYPLISFRLQCLDNNTIK